MLQKNDGQSYPIISYDSAGNWRWTWDAPKNSAYITMIAQDVKLWGSKLYFLQMEVGNIFALNATTKLGYIDLNALTINYFADTLAYHIPVATAVSSQGFLHFLQVLFTANGLLK